MSNLKMFHKTILISSEFQLQPFCRFDFSCWRQWRPFVTLKHATFYISKILYKASHATTHSVWAKRIGSCGPVLFGRCAVHSLCFKSNDSFFIMFGCCILLNIIRQFMVVCWLNCVTNLIPPLHLKLTASKRLDWWNDKSNEYLV